MSGRNEDNTDSVAGAPIDFDRIGVAEERFSADERFTQIDKQPDFVPDRLVCRYNQRYYPSSVRAARLEIVWFENGEFSLHYHEEHADGTFDHRWDSGEGVANTKTITEPFIS